MTDLPLGPAKLRVYALHKSVGLLLLLLAALRLLWRCSERRPDPEPAPDWQQRAAVTVVVLLYALMFLIPLSGWWYNSVVGFPLNWFGLVHLPSLAPADPTMKAVVRELHASAAWVLIVTVALHAAAAVKHHVVDRDRTLLRMMGREARKEAR